MEKGSPRDVCCSQKPWSSPWPGEGLIWEDAHVGTFPWQMRFCVPPLKQVLLGAEPGSLSLGRGFHLPLPRREGSDAGASRGEGFDTWAGSGTQTALPASAGGSPHPSAFSPKGASAVGWKVHLLSVAGRVPCGELLQLSTAANSRIWP